MRVGVFNSAEFRRIRDLPTRPQEWSPEHYTYAKAGVEAALRLPESTASLQPIQVRALVELATYGKLVAEVGAGRGKAQPLDAVVYCPEGARRMGDIKVGDRVLTPDGGNAAVLGVFYQGTIPIYKVKFSDGSETQCCGDHLWLTSTDMDRKHGYPDQVRTTADIRRTVVTNQGRTNHAIPVIQDAGFYPRGVKIPPYVLGVLLGDGCVRNPGINFVSADEEVACRVERELSTTPYKLKRKKPCKNRESHPARTYNICNKQMRRDTIQEELKRLGLYGLYAQEKFVPEDYLFNSRECRIDILRGLMDTDGYCSEEGAVSYYTTSPRLVEAVRFLVQSLGGTVSVRDKQTWYTYKGEKKRGQPSFDVRVCLPNEVIPFSLERKANRVKPRTKYHPTRYILSVEPAGEAEAQCLLIDHPDHLYVTDDFIVTHNSLLSYLEFTVLEAKRGLLLVPAHLREQTKTEWAKWVPHFRLMSLDDGRGHIVKGSIPGTVRLLSYSSLSTVRFANLLTEYQPDVVVCDEAQALACMGSARTRRVFRYLRRMRKSGAKVPFIPKSGTMKRKALTECAHLYEAALEDGSPIPCEYTELQQFHLALDEGVRDEDRILPGFLETLATPEEREEGLPGIRRAYRRRILSTPGVIATSDTDVDVPLILRPVSIEIPDRVRKAFSDLRLLGQLPSGDTFDGGVVAWNHARELACGFTYRWDPPPPPEWLLARKEWNLFVRDTIKSSEAAGRPIDSPFQVWLAVERGDFGVVPQWTRWREVRDTFTPKTVPDWLDTWLVKDAEDWALKTGGIVWVGHSTAFTADDESGDDDIGRAFTKIPYFGGGKQGDAIRTYRGPCVASIRSHGTGKNLQQWSQARILTLPSSGSTMEQLLARHQRLGQEADEVEVSFYLHSRELLTAWKTVLAEAQYAQDMNGSPQRILGATVLDLDLTKYDQMLDDRNAPPEWWPMGGW